MSHTSKKVHPMVQSNGRSLTPSPSPQPPTLSFTTSVLQKLGSIFKPEEKEETPKILQKKRVGNRTSSMLRKTRESRRFSAGSLLAETGDDGVLTISSDRILDNSRKSERKFWNDTKVCFTISRTWVLKT